MGMPVVYRIDHIVVPWFPVDVLPSRVFISGLVAIEGAVGSSFALALKEGSEVIIEALGRWV